MAEEIRFEEALRLLEENAEKLRSGGCSIEESVEIYNKCVKYYNICEDILKNVRQSIEILDPDSGETEAFNE